MKNYILISALLLSCLSSSCGHSGQKRILQPSDNNPSGNDIIFNPCSPAYFTLQHVPSLSQSSHIVSFSYNHESLNALFTAPLISDESKFSKKDDPLYFDNAVELMIKLKEPGHYLELIVNKNMLIYDALVKNPDADRKTMQVDTGYNINGLKVNVLKNHKNATWLCSISIPFESIQFNPRADKRIDLNAFVFAPKTANPYYALKYKNGEVLDFHSPPAWETIGLNP